MNNIQSDDRSFFENMPNHVLAHWLELQVILHCHYEDSVERQRDIDAKKASVNQYGYDIILNGDYFEIVKLP